MSKFMHAFGKSVGSKCKNVHIRIPHCYLAAAFTMLWIPKKCNLHSKTCGLLGCDVLKKLLKKPYHIASLWFSKDVNDHS